MWDIMAIIYLSYRFINNVYFGKYFCLEKEVFMKKSTIILIGCSTLLSFSANAIVFNHSGIQKGATSENCYHDPCSIVKVMDFQLLEKESKYHLIKLKAVGGTRAWKSKKIIWNHEPHNLYITCSRENPTVQNGDDTTTLPINPEMSIPGVLYGDGMLYSQACHNFNGDTTDLAKKYGYNITDW